MKKLSAREGAFVAALASGMSVIEAAKSLGVTERTARRWYAKPLVRGALKETQAAALDGASRRLSAGADEALDVLRDVMQDKSQSGAVRIRAAQAWIDTMFRARELGDIEERVRALEEAIHERARQAGEAGARRWHR